jgi:glycine/D-amino acid oxidase-like deaminating enzyme
MPVQLDVLIFGGGVAGLWALDELRRAGYTALLLESNALGGGQTVAAQGIIHGGFKYKWTLKGRNSAKAIAAMPSLWRDCIAGHREPKLSGTRVRSEFCYIWGARSQWSRFVAWAAGFGLRVKPRTLPRDEWPAPLKGSAGRVYQLGEQVIDPVSLVSDFARRNERLIRKFDLSNLNFEQNQVQIDGLDLHPNFVVFAAGEGNAILREKAGLPASAMQRRPLQMVMVRGKDLPMFFGHCIGGTKPRATITADVDSAGRTVWQIGGEPAESGVKMSRHDLIRHTKRELTDILPGIDLTGAEWATYTINRAEAATAGGIRPDDAQLIEEGNVLTAWPTKLALAPRLAEQILARIGPPAGNSSDLRDVQGWPRPAVAPPPWERDVEWSE